MTKVKDHRFPAGLSRIPYPRIFAILVINQILGWFVTRRWSSGVVTAYVDPGSGLLIWQLILATVVGCVFNIKKWISRFFRQGRSNSGD